MGSGRYLNFNKNHSAILRAIKYFLIPPPSVAVNKTQRCRLFLLFLFSQFCSCKLLFLKGIKRWCHWWNSSGALRQDCVWETMRWCWDVLDKHRGGCWTHKNWFGPLAYLCMLYRNKHVIHFPCLCRPVKQFPGQSKANNSQNGSCIQVDVWGAFMSHMFEVCWETRSSHYISEWGFCLINSDFFFFFI